MPICGSATRRTSFRAAIAFWHMTCSARGARRNRSSTSNWPPTPTCWPRCGIETTHLASISFGGIIALDFAIRHGERLQSLTVMSTFAELTPQLELLGTVMLRGLAEAGMPYLQKPACPTCRACFIR